MFPDMLFEIEGIAVQSDVSDQPMSEEETLRGALAEQIMLNIHFLMQTFG